MLCAMCVSMFATGPGRTAFPTIRGPHHGRIADMKAAAQQGCYLCSEVILDYEEDIEGEGSTHNIDISVSFELGLSIVLSPGARLGVLSFESSDGRLASATYELVYTEGLQKPIGYEEYLRLVNADLSNEPWRVRDDSFPSSTVEVPNSTGDPKVVELAGKWLKACLEQHTHCEDSNFAPDAPWFPKRLLDLSSSSGRPRLVVTANESPSERYATLSHCWGKKPICTLKADNIDEWIQDGIPQEILTETFKDAIAATRMLNIKYLWIDSLCILQAGTGSAEDWQEHAIAMRLVYTNSLVNIAAARAESGADGAFATRSDLFLRPCHVLWRFHQHAKDPFWTIRKSERHASFSIRTLPLYTRGWVVQERFLAPRVLHFGKDRLFWECKELPMVEESFPNGFQDSCPEYDNVGQWPFDLGNALLHDAHANTNNMVWLAWQKMINEYTRCDLTFPDTDMLIAIAGVAEKFGQFYNHEYIAGHFRQHLPFDLLWQNKGEEADTYRAPSWSWASRDEGVQFAIGDCPYCDRCCDRFASVKGSSVNLVNERAIYGQVRYAELTLTGYLIPCIIEPTKQAGTGLRQKMALYTHQSTDNGSSPGLAISENESIIWGEADLDNEEDSLRGFAGAPDFTAWALPIMELKPETADELDMHRGLVVKKTEAGMFARVGIYRIRNRVMNKILQRKCHLELDTCLI